MESILLKDHLSIKKLDPVNEKDRWLINELDKDELISGENGYLWPMKTIFKEDKYLSRNDIYGSPFGIYYGTMPVGFLALSIIMYEGNSKFVNLDYALLKQERKKGYMTKTLLEVSKMILLSKDDINKISLMIALDNISSQKVAEHAGFIRDYCSFYEENEMLGYQKTKRMLFSP